MHMGPARALSGLGQPAAARTNNAAPKGELGFIPGGVDGTRATLNFMREFVRNAVRNPDQIVRSKAEQLVRHLPERDWIGQIHALHAFVRDSIRYLRDPVGVERVATPEDTLDIGQGDCDDKATLLAALLESIGHPSRFVALAFDGGPFSHVLVETRVGSSSWMPLETIINRPPGWYPSGNPRRFIRDI